MSLKERSSIQDTSLHAPRHPYEILAPEVPGWDGADVFPELTIDVRQPNTRLAIYQETSPDYSPVTLSSLTRELADWMDVPLAGPAAAGLTEAALLLLLYKAAGGRAGGRRAFLKAASVDSVLHALSACLPQPSPATETKPARTAPSETPLPKATDQAVDLLSVHSDMTRQEFIDQLVTLTNSSPGFAQDRELGSYTTANGKSGIVRTNDVGELRFPELNVAMVSYMPVGELVSSKWSSQSRPVRFYYAGSSPGNAVFIDQARVNTIAGLVSSSVPDTTYPHDIVFLFTPEAEIPESILGIPRDALGDDRTYAVTRLAINNATSAIANVVSVFKMEAIQKRAERLGLTPDVAFAMSWVNEWVHWQVGAATGVEPARNEGPSSLASLAIIDHPEYLSLAFGDGIFPALKEMETVMEAHVSHGSPGTVSG